MANLQQLTAAKRNVMVLSLALLTLSACGDSDSNKLDMSKNTNVHDAVEAATGPLQDMNIRRTEIPPVLTQAVINPYAHPAKVTCDGIKSEVAQLDELLGPDMQSTDATLASTDRDLEGNVKNLPNVELPDRQDIIDGAGDLAHDSVIGIIHAHTNFLPFRGLMRKLTGAESHDKKLEEAYQAGKLRRAYLKGLAEDHFGPACLAHPIIVEATPAAVVAKADTAPIPAITH